jgi:tetratricopeptide (TPR) repeat protein
VDKVRPSLYSYSAATSLVPRLVEFVPSDRPRSGLLPCYCLLLLQPMPKRPLLHINNSRNHRAGDVSVDKETLISVGYRFLNTGRVRDAIKILQFEVRKYPEYWNAYDSLGEMYMKAGNNYQAIKNYENSLTLKPDNDGAAVALKALQKHDKRLGPY